MRSGKRSRASSSLQALFHAESLIASTSALRAVYHMLLSVG
jgi:hypothetical protein